MVASILIFLALALSACAAPEAATPLPEAAAPSNAGRALIERWRTQAAGETIENCLLGIELPNPLEITYYQHLVRSVWRSTELGAVRIFYTYNLNNKLFVLLSGDCSRRNDVAQRLRDHLRNSDPAIDLPVEVVGPGEAQTVIAAINET